MSGGQPWPKTAEELIDAQRGLDRADPPPWRPVDLDALHVAAAWVCFARGVTGTGSAGDPAWAAAVTMFGGRLTERALVYGHAASGYIPGLLALRIGPLLGEVVGHLGHGFDVLLVDADRPRSPTARRACRASGRGARRTHHRGHSPATCGKRCLARRQDGRSRTAARRPEHRRFLAAFSCRHATHRCTRRLANGSQHRADRRTCRQRSNADPGSAPPSTPSRPTGSRAGMIRACD